MNVKLLAFVGAGLLASVAAGAVYKHCTGECPLQAAKRALFPCTTATCVATVPVEPAPLVVTPPTVAAPAVAVPVAGAAPAR